MVPQHLLDRQAMRASCSLAVTTAENVWSRFLAELAAKQRYREQAQTVLAGHVLTVMGAECDAVIDRSRELQDRAEAQRVIAQSFASQWFLNPNRVLGTDPMLAPPQLSPKCAETLRSLPAEPEKWLKDAWKRLFDQLRVDPDASLADVVADDDERAAD